MQTFTGYEYLLIDAANYFGLDDLLFEERIQWTRDHHDRLESLVDRAKNSPQFLKAVMAIRAAERGEPIGHLVTLDATCSGIQIMSAITGCVAGATATGLVDPNCRADAYTQATKETNKALARKGIQQVQVDRSRIKYAVMTSCYGSKAVPVRLFGEDTPELAAFREACFTVAPGAFELLDELKATWQPYALSHNWTLPDGFEARIKVMEVIEKRIEIDELNHSTFTYQYKDNVGTEKGVANVANVVHSIDAYLLRCLIRRCNYDPELVRYAQALITQELLMRALGGGNWVTAEDEQLDRYVALWKATRMADVVILPHLVPETIGSVPTELLRALQGILAVMVQYRPFPLLSNHDSFSCHPNNMNHVRYWYKEVLAELAESNILGHILSQLYGVEGIYPKRSKTLPEKIRNSNYALC